MKLGKTLLVKLMNDYFSGNSWWVFGQFSENLKINRKPYENDSGLISSKIAFRKIVGKFSVSLRNIIGFAI